jgi:hypothetical protein
MINVKQKFTLVTEDQRRHGGCVLWIYQIFFSTTLQPEILRTVDSNSCQ